EPSSGLQEPPMEGATDSAAVKEPESLGSAAAAPATAPSAAPPPGLAPTQATPPAAPVAERVPAPMWFWIVFAGGVAALLLISWLMNWQRLEIFKMLLTSFFPLAVMIIAVLGSIVFGLATPTEAAAVGAFGGLLLAAAYRYIAARHDQRAQPVRTTLRDLGAIVKESTFLTAK